MSIKDLIEKNLQEIFQRSSPLPKLLRSCRDAYGVTRHRVCEDLGLSHSHLVRIENGEVAVTAMEAEAFAEYYGIDRKFLIKKANEFLYSKNKSSICGKCPLLGFDHMFGMA